MGKNSNKLKSRPDRNPAGDPEGGNPAGDPEAPSSSSAKKKRKKKKRNKKSEVKSVKSFYCAVRSWKG